MDYTILMAAAAPLTGKIRALEKEFAAKDAAADKAELEAQQKRAAADKVAAQIADLKDQLSKLGVTGINP